MRESKERATLSCRNAIIIRAGSGLGLELGLGVRERVSGLCLGLELGF